MVAIVSGNGVGLSNSSLALLGQGGILGDAQQGRSLDRVYVNAATGNLAIQRADEGLAGSGPDISVVRTYNSLGVLANDFDNQDLWLPGLYKKVYGLTGTVNTAGSTITRRDADGTEIVYTYNTTAAAYIATDGDGAHDTLSYAASVWTWTDGSSRFTETYDDTNGGRITARKDTDLNALTYTYNASGYISQVTSANGEITYFDYTGAKLTQVRTVTSGGTVTSTRVRYGYDASNRLSTVTVDLSPGDNSIADAKIYVTTYTYDSTSNRVASITQSDGSRIDFAYTLVGSDYRLTQVTQDPLGLNRITGIAYNTGTRTTTITDPLGQATVLTYDTSNRLLSVTGPAVGGVSQVVSYAYDGSGNVSQVTDARGNVTVYQYDANGNRTLERDAAGNTVTRTFSTTNQVLTQTVYVVPDPDGAGAGQPGTPATTRYAYDGENHLRFVVSGEGAVSESRYNTAGLRIQSIQYNVALYNLGALLPTDPISESTLATWTQSQDKTDTAVIDYSYDVRGQLATATRYTKVNASGQGVLDGTQATTNYVYDPAGNLLSSVDPRGVATTGVPNDYTTTYSYDGLNRLTASTDALGAVTLLQYDDANRKTVTTAANGLISTATYDKAGELVSILKSDATPTTFGETKYFYDVDGRLRMVKDPTGVNAHSLYDAASRKVADIDGTGSVTEYIYNANNQVVSTIRYANAANLSLLADGSGNPITVALSSVRPTANAADRRTWAIYDTAGRVVKTIDETGAVIERLYDGRSQLTKTIAYATLVTPASITTTTVATDAAVSPTTNANDRVSRFFYDNDSHIRGALDAEGYLTEYKYDAAGHQTEIIAYATATTAGLRATGTLAALIPTASADDIHTYRLYNASGQLVGDIDAEGYLTEHIYDLAGNQTQSIRYATKVNNNYLTSRSVTLSVQAKTSSTAISMAVNIDGVAVPGSPMSVTSTSYAAYNFTVTLVSGQNHAVDVVFTDAGPDLSIQSISLDGQVIQATDTTTTFDVGAGSAAFDGTGVVAGLQLLNQSGALRFAVYGLPRLRPGSVAADQSTSATYDALNHLVTQTTPDGTVSQLTYDNVGNVLTKSSAYGAAEVRTLTFKYDRLGQVTGELTGEGTALLSGLVNQVDIDAVWNAYGLKQTYDAAGRRTSTTDAAGNKTLFYYNADSQLTHTINALGEVFQSSYNVLNQLTDTVQYTLRLSAGTLATLQGGVADAGFLSTIAGLSSATLDAHRQLQYDLAGRISARIDALSHSVTSGYNAFGEETSRTTQIDASNSLVQATAYDHRSLATQVTSDSAGINLVQSLQYDAFGRQTQFTDGNGNLTTQSYDRLGRVVQVKDAFNKTDLTSYDAFNRVLTSTDRLGKVTNYVYDTVNRSVVVTTPEGVTGTTVRNRTGEVSSRTDGKGGITTFSYDRNGNLLYTVGPVATTSSRYDTAGRLIETTDANGIKIAYAYDAANRLASRTVDPDNATIPYVGLKLTTNYVYDGQGRSVWTQDPRGIWTQTEFDMQGEVTAVTADPKRSPAWVSGPDDNPNGLAIRTTYAYDYRGKTLTVTEGAGSAQPKVTQYIYDKLGRRTQGNVDPSGLNLTTTYAYDKNNNVTVKTDATGAVTRYYYDAEDRLIYTLDPTNGLIARIYDDKGQILQVLAYATALTGLPATPTVANIQAAIVANSATDETQRSVYDGDGREVYTLDALGYVTKKTFDANSNVIAQTRYVNAVVLAGNPTLVQVNSALTPSATLDRTTRYAYDAGNRLRYTVDALGYVSETKYDPAGQVTQTVLHAKAPALSASATLAELDALYATYGLTGTLTNAASTVSLSWSNTSQPAGATVTFQYRLVGGSTYTSGTVSVAGGTNTVTLSGLANGNYDYVIQVLVSGVAVQQASGQFARTAPATTAQTVNFAPIVDAQDRTERFEYDAAGRLSKSYDGEGFFEQYSYDAAGNKVSFTNKKGSVWIYTYDTAGRLISEFSPIVDITTVAPVSGSLAAQTQSASIETRMAYNALGNVASRTEAYGRAEARITSYVYDLAGRQTSTIFPQVGVYNSAGDNLTTNGINGTVTRTDSNVTPQNYVAYDALGRAVVNRDVANGYSYKVYDTLGRVVYEVDAEHYVTQYSFDAFGNKLTTKRYATAVTLTDSMTALTATQVAGWLTAQTSPQHAGDRTITSTFDRLNRATQVVEPSAYTYDSISGVTATVGRTTVNLYNGFGEVVKQTVANAATVYYFDRRGGKTAQVDALGNVTKFEYNATQELTRQVEYAQALTAGTWNENTLPAVTVTTTATNPNSTIGFDRETTAQYDRNGQKVAENKIGVQYTTLTGGLGISATSGNLTTTFGYDGVGNLVRTTDPMGASTYTYYDALGRVIATAEPTRDVNTTGGTVQMPPVGYSSATQLLTFNKPTLTGVNVVFKYKSSGASTWTTATLVSVGNTYTVNVASLSTDVYQYEMTYTKVSDSSTVATGTGTFEVQTTNVTTSVNAASFVDQRSLTVSSTSATYSYHPPTESESGTTPGGYWWDGSNSVSLSWTPLDNWQGGTVRIIVDYHNKTTGGGMGTAGQATQDYTLPAGMTGATVSWAPTGGGLYSVDRMRVVRYTSSPATATTIIDRTGAGSDAERLILQGGTTGITGINIAGVGVRTAAALGLGVFSIDLSGLARGTYNYTVVGNSSVGGTLEVKQGSVAGNPVLQEQVTGGTWRLSAFNIPADATSAVLQYRRTGDTGPYLAKDLTKQPSNEWTASYDDLAGGSYDYQIVVQRPGGPSTYTGTMGITRGGNLTTFTQSQAVAQTLTPLTVIEVDAFGATVQQTKYARGAAAVTDTVYSVAGADAADQVSYIQRDSHGNALWSQDAEGKASYGSYDVVGHTAKQWTPITDNDGRVQNAIHIYKYDKLGQQIETLDPSYLPNGLPATIPAGEFLENTALSYGIAQVASRSQTSTETGWVPAFAGSNVVNVSWGDMSAWGTGQVRVTIDGMDDGSYGTGSESGVVWNYGTPAARQIVAIFASTAASGSPSSTGYILASVSRARIEKQDASGAWILLQDRTVSGAAYGRVVTFATPTNKDVVQIKYRVAGSGSAWTPANSAQVLTFGSKHVFDIRTLATGSWEYETLYTRSGDSTPYARFGGLLGVNGASSTLGASSASAYPQPLNPANYVKNQVRYDAFGEITGKGVNDGWQESFEYDNAGHLWRTNQGDGASKVSLYDAAGDNTAQIAGRTTDLSTVADAAAAYALATAGGANPPAAVSWIRTKYDALGHATQQIQPSFNVASTSDIAPRAAESMTLNFSTAASGATVYTSANWNALSGWGTGAVQLYVNYSYRYITGYTESGETTVPVWSGWTATAVAVTLASNATSGAVGLGPAANYEFSVSEVRVFKQDSVGTWQTVHDKTATAGTYEGVMTWQSPTNIGTVATMEIRQGANAFVSRAVLNYGGRIVMDTAGLAAGAWDYRITYTLPGGAGTSVSLGTFTISGASLTVTNTTFTPVITTITPTVNQTYDRWGNVLSVSDPRNAAWVTSFQYNYLSQRIKVVMPQVSVGLANGTTANQTPTGYVYYDALGRQIASRDANTSTATVATGTVALDAAGQIIKETHADGGVINSVYDAFGRKTRVIDALGNTTNNTYDRMGRLTSEQLPIGTRSYTYDEVGDRITETDGMGNATRYWYDTRGKVIQTQQPMHGTLVNPAVTTGARYEQQSASYFDARGNLVKSIDANGNVGTWTYDYFGRVTAHTDMGGQNYTYAYDAVTKKLTGQTSGWTQNLSYAYYEDGKLKSITDNSVVATPATTFYEYDASGNRTRERYSRATTPNPTTYQDTRIGYDALGRISAIVDVRDTITYSYDAVGNRRHTTSQYFDSTNLPKTVDNWYLYDSMNRITLSQGVLVGATIQKRAYVNATSPAQGIDIAYDGAGNRRTATFYEGTSGTAVTETYTYDADNQLLTTSRAGLTTSARTYDLAGRVTRTIAYSSPNVVSVRRENSYNTDGWLTQTESYNGAVGSGTLQSRVSYTGFDNVGNSTAYQVYVPVGTPYTNYYSYAYQLRDSYKPSVVYGSSTYFAAGNTTSTYDANGNLTQVVDQFAANTTRSFINNQSGQILQKTENGQTQVFFYANGNPVGSSGIVNSSGVAITNPDFDYNYTPVNDRYPPATPGAYVVAQGDTLQGIALTLFGDASLWYIIADANGVRQDSDLVVGKTLVIPNKITNLHNSSDVHKPYQPGQIIGDTTPTLPDPPPPPADEGGGCGTFGLILIVAVAVVATIVTAGAALTAIAPELAVVGGAVGTTATVGSVGVWSAGIAALSGGLAGAGAVGFGIAAAAIGGAVGSIASQGVAIAAGMQGKFSWGSVALSAIAAGVGSGVGSTFQEGGIAADLFTDSPLAQMAIRSAATNALTQGLGVATGLQKSFDWKGVAAAAIASPVSAVVGKDIGGFPGQVAAGVVSGSIRALAYNGSIDFVAVAADAFGNALANDLVEKQLSTSTSMSATNSANNQLIYAANDIKQPSAANNYGSMSTTTDAPVFEQGYGPDLRAPEVEVIGRYTSKDMLDEQRYTPEWLSLGRAGSVPGLVSVSNGNRQSGIPQVDTSIASGSQRYANEIQAARDVGHNVLSVGKGFFNSVYNAGGEIAATVYDAGQLIGSIGSNPPIGGRSYASGLFQSIQQQGVLKTALGIPVAPVRLGMNLFDGAFSGNPEGVGETVGDIAGLLYGMKASGTGKVGVVLDDIGSGALNQRGALNPRLANRPIGNGDFGNRLGNLDTPAPGTYIELGSKEALAAKRVYDEAFNSQETLIIGRLDDTKAGAELGMRRLDDPDWTPNVNDAWIQGGINAEKPFYLGSNISIGNLRSGNPIFPRTVFSRELTQMRDAGYFREGDWMLPPKK